MLELLEEPTSDHRPANLDESDLLGASPLDARRIARGLPLGTRFQLRGDITPVQWAFLQEHGYLVFGGAILPDEVDRILAEMDQVEAHLRENDIEQICGVPVWFGTGPDGKPWLQRTGFASYYSEWLEAFLHDDRFDPIRRLIGDDARIGTREKDGVVFNRYFNHPGSLRPGVPWHTDALRDVFYNREMPGPMLNIGLHFDRIKPEDGGLRILPGTHAQSRAALLTKKLHFVSDDDDPDEVMVETWPGDLTVHDGRAWHRVKPSPFEGLRSIRRSMYIPYVVDSYAPKDESSKTPLYLRVFNRVIQLKKRRAQRRLRRA